MAKEIEVKVLDIDVQQVRKKLKKLGAKQTSPLAKQIRYVFDIDKNDSSRWIRLRQNHTGATLAVKIINSSKIDGTLEYETEIANIESTLAILREMGFSPKSYQENYREIYALGSAEISIDYWPELNPYLEIESSSKSEINVLVKRLVGSNRAVTSENTIKLYRDKGINLDDLPRLEFKKSQEKLIRS